MDLKMILVVVFFFLICPVNIIGLWWAVGSPLVLDPTRICRKTRRLRGKQAEICQNEPEVVREVAKGAQIGTVECQFQFRHRRWNCSTSRRSFGKVLMQDIRETAFLNAITAAGVTFAVTQACSAGHLLQCTCDRSIKGISTDGDWEWGGCGDNIDFGYKKSREFMDARDKKGSDVKTLILLHNNEAGRIAVKNYMRTECKCHGLSGSCTLKTCWRKLPIFRDVGDRLKEKFDGAAKVMAGNDGLSIIPVGATIKPPAKDDLIYSEDSPDFCEPNKKVGSLGTHGRECNHTSQGVGGCELLCCSRGYEKLQQNITENCRCRFIWCCEVVCDTCAVLKTIFRCL
uniref:Protein Wnt n=1 Tax=Euperipatoides kanangrensis TaxID=488523 RepID=A0A097ZRW5_9BILA|nr:WNT6 protein [Euperipatoides kanangrensis]